MITKVINVNLHQPIYERLTAKQGDIASRYLLFHLLDGDKPFDLNNRTVRVYAIKPDETEIFNDLTINDASKGYCTLELTSQCLASAGVVKMELYISESGKVLTSIPFELEVIACINTVNSVTSTNEFSALEVALGSLQDYYNLRNEIVQARKGYTTVGRRLDNFDSQLDTIDKNKQDVIHPSGQLDDTDYLNIMNNIEKYNYVLLGSGTFNLTKPIKIDNGNCTIEGYGSSTLLKCLHDDFCIIQSRSGDGADEGLKIFDLNILCQNGVKIGDIDLDILDTTSNKQQPYVMRCNIERVNITNINNNMTGIGVMFAKVFDSNIDKCCITGFEYGVRTKGCDIWNITNNRICLCSTLIYVQSTLPNGTFGSQCNIKNNDLLSPNIAFIRSSDRCINIENNYMENADSTKVDSAIYIHDGYYIRIHQNRIENKNPSSYTTIFENNTSYYIYYVGNTSNNINMSRGVKFLNPTALGYTYKYFKPIIIHFGNTTESGFPFNSDTDYDYSNIEKIVMSPMNGGLCSYAGGQYSPSRTAKVFNNSYVLENNSSMILSPTVINSTGGNETILKLVYSVLRGKSYKIGDIIRPDNNSCMMYQCTKEGTTSNNEVLYSEIKDEIVIDGTAEFTQFGVMATGNYKITATISSDSDNSKIIASFRTNDDVEISGQGVEVTGITKRKKQFILKEQISEFNISVKFYNSCGHKVYIENVVFEKL